MTDLEDPRYQEGLRDGRLQALEAADRRLEARMTNHEARLTAQERITYSLLGALALLNIWPAIERFLQ